MRPPSHTYDDIAGQYADVAEPLYFAAPARDLVALLDPVPEARLLDCGCGSGALAGAMRDRGLPRVVACDPSLPMLLVARSRTRHVAGGVLPHLPFRDGSFGAVALGFVLSHVADVGAALREVRRLLVPGGRIGVSSWSMTAGESEPGRAWAEVARRFAPAGEMDEANLLALPSEASLSTAESLGAALSEAGFIDVRTAREVYRLEMPASQYARSRLVSMTARFLAARLSAAAWSRFVAEAEEELEARFGEALALETGANFAVAATAAAPEW